MKPQILLAVLLATCSLMNSVSHSQPLQNSTGSPSSVYHPKAQPEEGSKGVRNDDPILHPITVRFAAFSGPEHGEHSDYVTRFQSALEKYLAQHGVTNGHSEWTVTGQVLHVEGPDTPFLTLVSLYRGNHLIGCWSGRAESVFHFDERMRNPTLNHNGLAGDIGDRLRMTLSSLEAQRNLRTSLETLHPDDMKLNLQYTDGTHGDMNVPIHVGALVSTHSDARLRLRLEAKGAKAVVAIAEDRNGRWIPLYVPDQEEGAFADGTVSFPLDVKAAFNGAESVVVWVIATDRDSFRKALSGAAAVSAGSMIVKEPGKETGKEVVKGNEPKENVQKDDDRSGERDAVPAIQVVNGGAAQSDLWQRNPMLRDLILGNGHEFHAIRFTLRRNANQDKFVDISAGNNG